MRNPWCVHGENPFSHPSMMESKLPTLPIPDTMHHNEGSIGSCRARVLFNIYPVEIFLHRRERTMQVMDLHNSKFYGLPTCVVPQFLQIYLSPSVLRTNGG